MTGTSVVDALNIPKVIGIFASLIISPIVGLVIAGGLIFLLRRYWSGTKKRARIHLTPAEREKKDGKKKPPFWTRIALILSAIGVSFSHGANDGQKGIGLGDAGADRRRAGGFRGEYECLWLRNHPYPRCGQQRGNLLPAAS